MFPNGKKSKVVKTETIEKAVSAYVNFNFRREGKSEEMKGLTLDKAIAFMNEGVKHVAICRVVASNIPGVKTWQAKSYDLDRAIRRFADTLKKATK